MPIRLALSLHAPETELRRRLMPVNDRYPLEDVLERLPRATRVAAAGASSSST